ncbi:MAG TPA: hypothetical protein VEO01_26425 [Pseudonocardiaceae bacterium]|nr:hypothetical protein [Pseudonocardiaceae bacterium]
MTTVDLGDLSRIRPENDASFGWFNTTIRVHPRISNLLLHHFMSQAERIDETDIAAALKFLDDYFRRLVHPEDFVKFWELSMDNGCTSDDLLGLAWVLVEKLTANPTGARPGSSPTPRSIPKKSRAGSSSLAIVRTLEKSGRPDLALAVKRAQRVQAAERGKAISSSAGRRAG